jgi:hypothetical protein
MGSGEIDNYGWGCNKDFCCLYITFGGLFLPKYLQTRMCCIHQQPLFAFYNRELLSPKLPYNS